LRRWVPAFAGTSGEICNSINITMTDIPENAARARQMYSEGATTRDILAETELSHWGLYHWLAGGPKQKNGERLLPELPKRRMVVRRKILKENRVALVNRMMKTAERQVYEIEARLAGSKQAPGERERDARTLAVLAKTLQSLTAIDALHEPKAGRRKKQDAVDDDDEDYLPADIEGIYRELSRKMEAMAAGGPQRIPGESEDKAEGQA
jgi:hypothetical protein